MKHNAVFCDTSFFIRLLDEKDPLHKHARGYFRYFLENNYPLVISPIAIGEYCVGGDIHELPLRNLQVLPFNFDHATRAGELARLVFSHKNKLEISRRNIIPNDTKLFAQADQDLGIRFMISSDRESAKIYQLLCQIDALHFQLIDLGCPYHEFFGILDI